QEVEATCDRIIIVARGELVADGTHRELCERLPKGAVHVELVGPGDTIAAKLSEAFPGARVEKLPVDAGQAVRFKVERNAVPENEASSDMRGRIADLAQQNGWKVLELRQGGASLEDVFRHLTYEKSATVAQGAA
ncbi:MAG TPA: hypothetical protein PKE00_01000, partial [Planctomycetota bacterium]|nr:hypothetical protein [Planctomycetota bacterium]